MLAFPNAKINIGLYVKGKRSDGFHDIESVFYPVALRDALELLPAKDHGSPSIFSSGIHIPGNPAKNLCIKAYELLQKDFEVGPIKFHLHKNIPAGAGMGGGSSDAVSALLLLKDLFRLDISDQRLLEYTLQLGSDCPFFLLNKPALVAGRGELLEQVNLDLSGYSIVLINPGIHVDTARAFAAVAETRTQEKAALVPHNLRSAVTQPVEEWRKLITNDFEPVIAAEFPEIARLKEQLYSAGALYAAMSGSGSTVYGIFNKGQKLNLKFPAAYFCRTV